ncbi:hypothetical protein HanRHA438_Chr03g0110571 [Helianthus annuus]|nr:hypothetical protein HanRHA438_Chr03g0110571 [Helianthus annuus]
MNCRGIVLLVAKFEQNFRRDGKLRGLKNYYRYVLVYMFRVFHSFKRLVLTNKN